MSAVGALLEPPRENRLTAGLPDLRPQVRRQALRFAPPPLRSEAGIASRPAVGVVDRVVRAVQRLAGQDSVAGAPPDPVAARLSDDEVVAS